ncbi:ATP-dependent DNA helicase RecG [Agreia sp. COWG]|uniref:ATP-dependent DNA helicase RecG n=1 Tax=Agreia sp. COWG TaxID=2773266 RepID=UPI00192818B4|nr:ATP-dependent DNA helicase RecG [Agreia sp. COWG]
MTGSAPVSPHGVSILDKKLTAPGVGVGGKTATPLQKSLGIVTVGDLLSHYPRRYALRGELTALDALPLGENVTIVAEVRQVQKRTMKSKRGSILEARLSDGQGYLTITFFNQAWREATLVPGARGVFTGKVTDYRGALQLAHPAYELFDDIELKDGAAATSKWLNQPIPIYPATSAITSWEIAATVKLVLDNLLVGGAANVPDPVPDEVALERGLLGYGRALELLHRPEQTRDWQRARDALRFQEAFVLQAALLEQRRLTHESSATPRVPKPGGFLERFDARLPFELTGDQKLVGSEIAADMAKTEPMNRLVQGEVGSGKTIVALRAMLATADSGGQSALLAPTEVLASQHLRSIVRALGPDLAAELIPTLHTGQLPTADRRKALLRMVSGQSRIVVGTHALLGDKVTFYDLGLVVVDEQHRFGVDQRDDLRRKGATPPHVLVLTATPIPRTVAMTVFGDLDVSTIAELPAGRQPIETFVVPLAEKPGWSARIWTRMAEELALDRQAFVVCPAIDAATSDETGDGDPDGDDLLVEATTPAGKKTARTVAKPAPTEAAAPAPGRPIASVEAITKLVKTNPALAGARVASLHGRMPSEEKEQIMRAFADGDIDVIVATTVIEVGVDVPNASTMVVMDAERFGVSQLHQLRGRVGRGGVPGLCLLVTNAELETVGRERVDAVASTLDGFELAQIDLELRHEGNVLGRNQSGGKSSLRLLRVTTDGDLITDARMAASLIVDADPGFGEHPALREALDRRLREVEAEFLVKS